MNTKKYRKGQVKMFESIAVLIIFVFIVAIGVKFYTNIQINHLKEAEKDFSELDSVKTSIILSNLPEISCSFEGISSASCLDLYKVISWSSLMENKEENLPFIDYYIPVLGRSEIYVERIYPLDVSTQNKWVVYNASIKGSFDYLRLPVVLYDTIERKNQLGILHIKTYI